jgi:hypothetical protein
MANRIDQSIYLQVLATARAQSKTAEQALYILDNIDVKASGLLSFLGALMAGVFFYLNMVGHGSAIDPDVRLFALLTLATLAIASGLALSCVYIIGPHQTAIWISGYRPNEPLSAESLQRAEDDLVTVSARRIGRYMWALRMTYLSGLLLFLSLLSYYAGLKIVSSWLPIGS